MGPQRRHGFGRSAPERLTDLAASLRRLTEQMLRTDPDGPGLDEELERAAREIDLIRARLEPHARGTALRLGRADDPRDGRSYYVSGPTVGPHHPMFPDMEIVTRDGVTTGRVHLDVAWEGPPGCVHGGYVAYLYDCIMGHHNVSVGIPGMTGTLAVRFRRPTPLYAELRFEARTARSRGRRIATEAHMRLGDELLTEAQGLFIRPRDFLDNLSAP